MSRAWSCGRSPCHLNDGSVCVYGKRVPAIVQDYQKKHSNQIDSDSDYGCVLFQFDDSSTTDCRHRCSFCQHTIPLQAYSHSMPSHCGSPSRTECKMLSAMCFTPVILKLLTKSFLSALSTLASGTDCWFWS